MALAARALCTSAGVITDGSLQQRATQNLARHREAVEELLAPQNDLSRLILKNETDSPACVNTRSKNFSEKIQLAGPSNWVRPKPVRPRSFPPKQPLERKSFACYFCAGK